MLKWLTVDFNHQNAFLLSFLLQIMKRLLLMALVSLVITSLTLAEKETVSTGPYKITFDLGLPHNSSNITVSEPKVTETLSGEGVVEYNIILLNKIPVPRLAMLITIKHLDKGLPKISGTDWAEVLKSINSEERHTSSVLASNRTIDGVDGAVMSGAVEYNSSIIGAYQAIYQPSFDPTHTSVSIISYYPWDEGTRQLLNTIHVSRTS